MDPLGPLVESWLPSKSLHVWSCLLRGLILVCPHLSPALHLLHSSSWKAGEWAGPDLSSCMERSQAVAMRTDKQALEAIWPGGPGQEQSPCTHCPSSFLWPASPSTGPANRKPQTREPVPTDQTGFPSRLLFSKFLTSHPDVIYYIVLLFPKWNAYLLNIEFIYNNLIFVWYCASLYAFFWK